jgi:phosphotransferase system enzyme I (PtsP)
MSAGAGALRNAAHGVREDDRMLRARQRSGEQRETETSACSSTIAAGARARGGGVGLTAEAGVQRAFDDVRTRLGQSTDPYIRERLSDLQDLTNRLLLRLTGRAAADPSSLPDDMIVIARDMGPAELLDYDRTRLRGLVLEEGSALSHVAIVARALGVPVVGRAPGVRADRGGIGSWSTVTTPRCWCGAEDILQTVYGAIDARAERRRKYAARDLPSTTRDQAASRCTWNGVC